MIHVSADFLLGAGCNDNTVIHDCHFATDLFNFRHVVGGVQDAGTGFIQLFYIFQDAVSGLWVNADSWLIHDDKFGFVHNAAGEV